MYVLYTCMVIALVQGIHCSDVDIELQELDLFDSSAPINNDLYLTELDQGYELSQHKKNCSLLVKGVLDVFNLSQNMTAWAYESSMQLQDDVYAAAQCTALGKLSCLFKNLQKAREDVLKVLPQFVEYRKKFQELYREVKNGLHMCFFLNLFPKH